MTPRCDVTIPAAGSTTARGLTSNALRRALRDLMALPRGRIGDASWDGYRSLRPLLADVARREPAALASLVRRPGLGTRVRCLRDPDRQDVPRDEVLDALVTVALAELGIAGLLPEPIRLERFAATWVSWLGRARVRVPHGTTALRIDADTIFAETAGGTRQVRAERNDAEGPLFTALSDHTWLVRADDNPLALTEAHPDKDGNAVDLGSRPARAWADALTKAHALLAAHVPGLAADFDVTVQQVVPVGYDERRHLSASYRENLGTVYLSLHPDPMTMGEALLHEMSHNKLNALREVDPLLATGDTTTYSSPVRPDPRPLIGVLLAVHAFVPVAHLYRRMIEDEHPWSRRPSFHRRFDDIRRSNVDGLATLQAHAEPTDRGRALLDELSHHVAQQA